MTPAMMPDPAHGIDRIAMTRVHTTLCGSPLGVPPSWIDRIDRITARMHAPLLCYVSVSV